MIRRTFNYSKFLIATLLLSANNIFAQSRSLKNVENTVKQGGDSLINILVIIGRVAYLSIGTFLVVRLIFILTSSDRGEDKVMKIGGLAVVLILGAIVVMMAEGVFS
jgi:hypothetical protein